eukprot:jgi/Ulvmu1/10287/UM060_0089.1
MSPQASQSGAPPPTPSATSSSLEASLLRVLTEHGHIPHVSIPDGRGASVTAGIDLAPAGAPSRFFTHERLCHGAVHAAAVRELFLHRASAELSAVPRNAPQSLEAENSALEQFARAPREPSTFLENVFSDYMQLEAMLRTQTGALAHARLLGPAAQDAAAVGPAAPPAEPPPTAATQADQTAAAPPVVERQASAPGEQGDAMPLPAARLPFHAGARASGGGADDAAAAQAGPPHAAPPGPPGMPGTAADASPSRSLPSSPLETKPTHLLLDPRAPAAAGGSALAAAPAVPGAQPSTQPGGAAQPPLDAFIDDPSLLQCIAEYVPKVVAKELPNPGESSDAGTSEVWQQLKQRDSQGRLGGISPHQGSTTSFTISIPFFNTTLSRVNRLEIAAVVEVLLSLRCCRPRNIEPPIARNLRLDVIAIVKHMAAAPRDSSRLSYTMRTPKAGLHYPDMTIIYKVVLTRIHRWAEQIARRVDKDSLVVRRGGRKRKPSERSDGSGRGGGGEGGRRSAPPRNMQTRGVVLPMSLDVEGEEEEEGEGDEMWGEEGDERASAGGGSGAAAARADSDSAVGAVHGDALLPPLPAAIAGATGVGMPDVRRAGSLGRLGVGTQSPGQGGAHMAPGGRGGPAALAAGGGAGGPAAGGPAAADTADPGLLPFADVVHIFQKPYEHLVDFQQMLNSMRRVFAAASAACGLSHSYAGVFTRFCRRLATDLSENKSLECVAVYNGMYECAQNGQHYALLQVVDTYLAE